MDTLESLTVSQLENVQPNMMFQLDDAPLIALCDYLDENFPNTYLGQRGHQTLLHAILLFGIFGRIGFILIKPTAWKDFKRNFIEKIYFPMLRRFLANLKHKFDFLRANNGKPVEKR